MRIWKYVLHPEMTIEMPKGPELLSISAQGDDICLWAKVDALAVKESRSFITFGTGHIIPDHLDIVFVGTAIIEAGELVFHVFERV